MIVEIRVPRINNNDDDVRLARLRVHAGADVSIGQALADLETDKAAVSVEAPDSGRVLGVNGRPGEMIRVGSPLLWIGTEAGDVLPEMPLFLTPDEYLPVPLEATYRENWGHFPAVLKALLERPGLVLLLH